MTQQSVSPTNQDSLEKQNRPASVRAAQFMAEHEGSLPVWVRAPKRGHEFYSGCTRAKLYEWAGKGFIRSVPIRDPGRVKGIRLFHLASILAFIERCEAEENSRPKVEPRKSVEGQPGILAYSQHES
jgi:hypothetical protein